MIKAAEKETALGKGEPYSYFPTDYVISYRRDNREQLDLRIKYTGSSDLTIENIYDTRESFLGVI